MWSRLMMRFAKNDDWGVGWGALFLYVSSTCITSSSDFACNKHKLVFSRRSDN